MTDQNLLAIIIDRTENQKFYKYFQMLKKQTGFSATEIQGALIKIGLNHVLASKMKMEDVNNISEVEKLSFLASEFPKGKFHKIPKEMAKALLNTVYEQ